MFDSLHSRCRGPTGHFGDRRKNNDTNVYNVIISLELLMHILDNASSFDETRRVKIPVSAMLHLTEMRAAAAVSGRAFAVISLRSIRAIRMTSNALVLCWQTDR